MEEKLELELLSKLKAALLSASKSKNLVITEDDFGSYRWNESKKREFYLYDYRKNLFEIPENGIHLGTGIEAVRSSAAMIFNLLGQKELIIGENKYTSPEYEAEFKAIKDENEITHNAHLDVVFYSENKTELHAIEAKMMEWINSPKNLSPAYLKEEMYVDDNKKSSEFIQFFNSLIKKEKQYADCRFAHKTERYDAIQMTIHILALYNYICKGKNKSVKKVLLHNIVWKYECEDYKTEEREAQDFIKKANEVFSPLFEELGVSFKVEYETFQDFKNRIDFLENTARLQYLKRYEI